MRSTVTALTLLAALAGAGAAHATVAPGLVTAPVPGEPSASHGYGWLAATASAPLPGGRLITAGVSGTHLVLARFHARGTLDRSFGRGGMVRLKVAGYFRPGRVLPMPDGRLVVVGSLADVSWAASQVSRTLVVRVRADGRPDMTFGRSGSVSTPIRTSRGSLQPDGKVILTGTTGDPPQPPTDPGTLQWKTTRLGPSGAVDRSFGSNGIVTHDGTSGLDSAVSTGGRIVLTGQRRNEAVLLALKPDGTLDEGFNGGQPRALTFGYSGDLIARPDGSVDVSRVDPVQMNNVLIQRFSPDGSLDPEFRPAHVRGREIVPAPDGSIVAFRFESGGETRYGDPMDRVRVVRVLADGTADPEWGGAEGTPLSSRFGGGGEYAYGIHRDPDLWLVGASGFWPRAVTVRPDGGLHIAGTVAVLGYTYENSGTFHQEIAVAAYRPDLSLDRAWGGPAKPGRISISVPRQRARTVALHRRPRAIRVLASTSGAGSARVVVRARGEIVALRNIPVYRSGPRQALEAWLTLRGRRILARTRTPIPIRVSVHFRDLVRSKAWTVVHARLR